MTFLRFAPACFALLLGCEDNQVAMPPPAELTSDSVGHYCSMIVADHPGPKAQIFTTDMAEPLWFPSVRDMFAYTMLPEENQDIRVIYVSDTGAAANDALPAANAWIEAKDAVYILDSEITGGMGLPETVPFANANEARAFAARHGGRVVSFDEVTPAYVFADIETHANTAGDKL